MASPDGGETAMENWAFAAPPQHPFVLQWRDNFRHALTVGPEPYVNSLPRTITGAFLANFSYLAQHNAWKEAISQLHPKIQYFQTPDEADPDADIRLMYSYRVTSGKIQGPFMYQTLKQLGGFEFWMGAWVDEDTIPGVFSCATTDCTFINSTITPFLKFRRVERDFTECPLEKYGQYSWLAMQLLNALHADSEMMSRVAQDPCA